MKGPYLSPCCCQHCLTIRFGTIVTAGRHDTHHTLANFGVWLPAGMVPHSLAARSVNLCMDSMLLDFWCAHNLPMAAHCIHSETRRQLVQ
jgi:hypothetical protein